MCDDGTFMVFQNLPACVALSGRQGAWGHHKTIVFVETPGQCVTPLKKKLYLKFFWRHCPRDSKE